MWYLEFRLKIRIKKQKNSFTREMFVSRPDSTFISSPEPEAQVSFSDHSLSVVVVVIEFVSNVLLQFQPNLAQSILRWGGFKVDQMKTTPFSKGT